MLSADLKAWKRRGVARGAVVVAADQAYRAAGVRLCCIAAALHPQQALTKCVLLELLNEDWV